MIGILTEKPSARRSFAAALGGEQGTYNGEQYVLVSARGHLYEFDKPEGQVRPALAAQYKSWNLTNLPWEETDFHWKRVKKKDAAPTLKAIKDVLSKCSEIVIACDVDPTGEGDLIAWEIIDELGLRANTYSRMYFYDEEPKSLQDAFVNRKVIQDMHSDGNYNKATYRSQFDYLSMQFTRIATACGDGQSVLRQGRLKSAMVVLTGDGLMAVKQYKKIPSYQNRFRDENGNLFINPEEPSFPDKTQVPQTYTNSNVILDGKSMKSTAPPKLLDLAGLSSMLSSKGIKAKDVLSVYQKMYESKIVSYPRTEDKTITPEQFNALLPKVDAIANLVGVDIKLLTHRVPRKTHVKNGGAHGANRPGMNVPGSLDELDKFGSCAQDIYLILARNYLAMLAEDYEYEQQKGHLEKYPLFTGSANVPKKIGFKAVFSGDDDDDIDENSQGLGKLAEPFVHEGFPPRPPHPTMKWLMKQLKQRDVGTGATRTSIYADVTSEKAKFPLLIEKKGKLSMSSYGEMSYHLLKDTHIGDLTMTEQLMSNMRGIADGTIDPKRCLFDIKQLVRDDILVMKKNGESMRKELGVKMISGEQKEKYKGVWAKTGHEVSFSRTWSGYRFSDEECEALLNGDNIQIDGVVNSKGETYSCLGELAEQVFKGTGRKFIGFNRTGYPANGNGGNGMAKKEKCSGVWAETGKEISFSREWSGYRFSDEECEKLLNGETIQIDGVVSQKTGKPYSCLGKLDEQTIKKTGYKYVGFNRTGYPESGVPAEWCKHVFTDDEKTLLEAGKSIELAGCVSKKGSVFSCKVSWGKNDKGKMAIIPDFGR